MSSQVSLDESSRNVTKISWYHRGLYRVGTPGGFGGKGSGGGFGLGRVRLAGFGLVGMASISVNIQSQSAVSRKACNTVDRMAAHPRSDQRRDDLCEAGLRKCASLIASVMRHSTTKSC